MSVRIGSLDGVRMEANAVRIGKLDGVRMAKLERVRMGGPEVGIGKLE